MTTTWTNMLVEQLEFYMNAHLLPRLDGLDDAEYFWEPVANCWSVRQDATGAWYVDGGPRDAERPTTIAWRLTHLAVDNLGTRALCYFGEDDVDSTSPDDMFSPRYRLPPPTSSEAAVALLADVYTRWRDGIAGLDDERLAAPVGPKGGPFAEDPFAALVLHVSRETMHHGGEIGVLRDLYANQ
jgi:hypothetical protein